MEFLAVMWVFTALWCVHWFHDRPKRPLVLLWIWLPTLRTALLLASLRTPEYQPLMVFEVLLGLAMLAWPFWREPVRSLWSTATLFAALAAVLGAAYLLTGLVGTAAGEWWSIWEDPRPGVIYDQYPLTNSEAVTAGAALLGIAAVVAGALVVTARRVWSDRTD